jgi:hypothetical protein
LLFVGDDWAEDHHDVEVMDPTGRRLAKARLAEGAAGITRLHELIGAHLGDDTDAAKVVIGIETDRGPWVQALLAAGYRVYAINPLQGARYRERHSVSGAKSDAADAHTLADMVRTDAHQLRPVAGDSAAAEAIKVVTRAHKTLIFRAHPARPAAAACAAGLLSRRAGGVRGSHRRRGPAAVGQGPRSGQCGAADHGTDHSGAETCSPP